MSWPFFNDFAHIPWEDTPNFPKPHKERNSFIHCWWNIRGIFQNYVGEISEFCSLGCFCWLGSYWSPTTRSIRFEISHSTVEIEDLNCNAVRITRKLPPVYFLCGTFCQYFVPLDFCGVTNIGGFSVAFSNCQVSSGLCLSGHRNLECATEPKFLTAWHLKRSCGPETTRK